MSEIINKLNKLNKLSKELKTKKVIFGPRVILKNLKNSNIEKIYISNDFPESIIKDLQKFKSIKDKIIRTDMNKEELKEMCKRPFNISIISILRDKKESKEKNTEGKQKKKEKEKNKEKKTEKHLKKKTDKLEKRKNNNKQK